MQATRRVWAQLGRQGGLMGLRLPMERRQASCAYRKLRGRLPFFLPPPKWA